MTAPLSGPNHAPLSCGKPAWLVVLLHEHGSDGDHVVELALDWAPNLLKAEFIAPHAPLGEGRARHWFGADADGQPDPAALDAAAAAVLAAADGWLAERGLGAERLGLLGFGAGATVALRAGLSRPGLGAVVAIGGGVAGAVPAPPVGAGAESLPELLLVEGADPAPAGTPDVAASAALLVEAGWTVQRQSSPGDWHGLTEAGIDAIARFLKGALTRVGVEAAGEEHDH
ncbi:alpha/beta hydrolase [Derxia lacustris]|uniref:alpha/beta hydrolase n=1 Tax=Derxia lacustris TaxID=764842 RepID=UPI000A171558|nr:hypothetical protein [Derxia lacustris]